ncbi:MAG TPA: hypothetical protein VLR91_03040 [Thermodesulfobacteriota bacterium]|nr:hypothetical protein [Thermodesulfobacteriota bacterium]
MVIKPQRAIKIVGLLAVICFMAAFGMGCTCFTEATAEPPKVVAAPPPPPPPPPAPPAAKCECDTALLDASVKKAEMAAQRAEDAAARAEKAAEKAEAAANKAEAVFMKKMKK